MRAEGSVVLYAVGGGHGHARRGWLLQRALREEHGVEAALIVRDPAALGADARATAFGPVHASPDGAWPAAVAAADVLYVDTFPDGWRGAFPRAAQRAVATRRLLVARAVFGGRAVLPGTEDFDAILSPYGPETDEWEGRLPQATRLGLVIGDPFVIEDRGPELLVVDPDRRADAALHALFRRAAAKAGLAYRYMTDHERRLTGRKILFVGAGYHTVYEALASGADVRFLPLARQFDDQRARAARYGRAVEDPKTLLAWLTA